MLAHNATPVTVSKEKKTRWSNLEVCWKKFVLFVFVRFV